MEKERAAQEEIQDSKSIHETSSQRGKMGKSPVTLVLPLID